MNKAIKAIVESVQPCGKKATSESIIVSLNNTLSYSYSIPIYSYIQISPCRAQKAHHRRIAVQEQNLYFSEVVYYL